MALSKARKSSLKRLFASPERELQSSQHEGRNGPKQGASGKRRNLEPESRVPRGKGRKRREGERGSPPLPALAALPSASCKKNAPRRGPRRGGRRVGLAVRPEALGPQEEGGGRMGRGENA
eukprot:2020763-Pyramimonas_sp.AAC.1